MRIDDAGWAAFEAAAGGDPHKLAALSRTAMEQQRADQACRFARAARDAAPGSAEIAAMTWGPLALTVPKYHAPMVQDRDRNQAYSDAIERAVKPGMRVLDIGSGTGLLAMIAARAGATVFTCEAHHATAAAARDVIARNGLSDRVAVIGRHSTRLDADKDLGGRVDLLVSEILSSDLLSEEVLPAVADAAARLLAPGAPMIPHGGEIRVALANWPYEARLMDEALGFDLTPFNPLVGERHLLRVGHEKLELASEAATLFDLDFTRAAEQQGAAAQLSLAAQAPANGIVQWIRIRLDDATIYENEPAPGARSAWNAVFYPLPRSFAVGESVTVHGRYARTALWLWA